MKKTLMLMMLLGTANSNAAPIFELRDSVNNEVLLLQMTDQLHNNALDNSAIAKAEFGNVWELADWQDIKRFANSDKRALQLADYLRLNNYYEGAPGPFSALVTVQNDGVKEGLYSYPYFMAANYGTRPGFYPYHDDISDDTLTLHNWAANAHILGAVKTQINDFKTVSASAETQFLSAASKSTDSSRKLRSTRVSIDEMIANRPERKLVEKTSDGFEETSDTLGKSYSVWTKIMNWFGFGSRARDTVVETAIDQINRSGQMQERCLELTESGTTAGALECVEVLSVKTSSPAGFVYEGISAEVGQVEFDFRLENFGANDELFLMFNGERIYDFDMQGMLNGEFYRSGRINLSDFNLFGGNFGIGINSDQAGRIMDVSSLSFYAKTSSVLAPTTASLLMLGCCLLFARARRRS